MVRLVKLIGPNGVEVEAREEAVEKLLESGWARADGRKPRTTRKRTTKAKQ